MEKIRRYKYNRRSYQKRLKGVDPISVIGDIAGLLTHIFGGGGQVYGADFAYRNQMITAWAQSYGLAGTNAQYINPSILKSLAIEDPSHPSPYSRNGGVWQADIPQFFQNVSDVINNQVNNPDYGFKQVAQSYYNQIKSGTVTPGGTPVIPSGFSGFNISTILLIGAGVYLVTTMGKSKKRK